MSWEAILKYTTPYQDKRKEANKVEKFANAIALLIDNNETVIKINKGHTSDGPVFDINNPQHLIKLAREGLHVAKYGEYIQKYFVSQNSFDLNKPHNMKLFMTVMGQKGYN